MTSDGRIRSRSNGSKETCRIQEVKECSCWTMKIQRMFKHKAQQICKLLIWTNIFVFLYLLVHNDSESNSQAKSALEKEGLTKLIKDEGLIIEPSSNFKFKNFNQEKWNETQRFRLEDTEKTYFRQVNIKKCSISK